MEEGETWEEAKEARCCQREERVAEVGWCQEEVITKRGEGSVMAIPYKLRVMYIGRLNEDMDDNMIALAKKYGYELSTTGYDTKKHERQLNFEEDEE